MPPVTLQNRKNEFTELLVSRIENAHIENTDALTVVKSRNIPDTFFRLDPPYENADQGHYKGLFTTEMFKELLSWLTIECKGKFLLSNYNSDILSEYIELNGWYKREIKIRLQSINKNYALKDKTEVLVWNYELNEGQQKLFNH